MKTLYLLRHAPAAPDVPLPDHDRPLSDEGEEIATSLGRYLQREGLVPQVVLCSTALRARQTWEHLYPAVGEDAAIIYEEQLYGASSGRLLDVIGRVGDTAERVLVVAHNPGIGRLARQLATGEGDDVARLDRGFAAGALAVLEAEVEAWDTLKPGGCVLERLVDPEQLSASGEGEG